MRQVDYGKGPKRTECLGWVAKSVEGEAESTRVTENHVETMDSSDRGIEGLTIVKRNIDLIK